MKILKNKAVEVIKTPIKREWLSPNEVSKEFGYSVSTLAKWRIAKKHLKFSKMSKYIKYRRSDIEEFLETHIINVEVA